MIYYTGDIHGNNDRIVEFCHRFSFTSEDVIVILGDVGANYYRDEKDRALKESFARLPPTILCIHGNHEIRPRNIPTYKTMDWHGGTVWYEDEYPNLLFAKDGEIYDLDGVSHLVIGGAYSVDKFYRIARNYGWWEDEQPSEDIKAYVEAQVTNHHVDVILSHTCPFKYEPTEVFLPFIDQSQVDAGTEHWLDTIEERADYKAWLCGHWHVDKRIDKLWFLYHSFVSIEQL